MDKTWNTDIKLNAYDLILIDYLCNKVIKDCEKSIIDHKGNHEWEIHMKDKILQCRQLKARLTK